MVLLFVALFLSSFSYASEAQKKFDLAWEITKNKITLAQQNGKAPKRNLTNYLKAAAREPHWQTVQQLPEPLKEKFFNLVRNTAVNNPQDYWFMRNYIAGCAWAGCIIEEEGFDEERLVKLMIKENDVDLLIRISFKQRKPADKQVGDSGCPESGN